MLSDLKEQPLEVLRGFVNSCLTGGWRVEPYQRKYAVRSREGFAPLSATTLRALAVALVLEARGVRDVSYEELWKHAVARREEALSPSNRRKYAETLRGEWSGVLGQCGLAGNVDMPLSSERIPLAILFPPFDRSRARKALHKLAPPRLVVAYEGVERRTIVLDVLEPDEWKVVGHSRSPEPAGKIGIDDDIHLSREAFEIKLDGGVLSVRVMARATNPLIFRGKASKAFELRNGEEFLVGKLRFRFDSTGSESDVSTPRYPRGELE